MSVDQVQLQADLETVRTAVCGALKPPVARKLQERVRTVACVVRLPLPSDGTCNQTPMVTRWSLAPDTHLQPTDPRYATEEHCREIEAELWAQLVEFDGAPAFSVNALGAANRILNRPLIPRGAKCFLSGEPLAFADVALAVKITTSQVGAAELPVEYRSDLRSGGKHRPGNLAWVRTAADLVVLRDVLERNGVPDGLLAKVQVKAYATDKVTMPPHYSNRDYRWATWVDSIQFAARTECQGVELELLSQILEFNGAPQLSRADRESVERNLGRVLVANSRHCPITGLPMNYAKFVAADATRAAGRSAYHVGHLDPLTRGGKHVKGNVVWMSEQGNRIQGNDSFEEIVALIRSAAAYHQERNATGTRG